jgi:DNA-binding transcriptional MocR family regulator
MNSCNESQRGVQGNRPVQSASGLALGSEGAAGRISKAIQAIALDRSSRVGLVNQIVEKVSGLVADGLLKPMDKMPSVRHLARQVGVSAFTIVEAYDRLVSSGHLVSRRGAGYFVAASAAAPRHESAGNKDPHPTLDDSDPYAAEVAVPAQGHIPLGCSWLPPDWHDAKWMQDCAKTALRSGTTLLQGGLQVLGDSDLRRQLARRMAQNSVAVDEDHLMLTRGAMHGTDLVLGVLTRPGDHVLVEDPTHPGLLPLLARHGCVALPVTRSRSGLDMDGLADLADRHRPKLAIVTTALHNPLGTSLSAQQAHRLLALAEQFDFMLVEDDVFRDLADEKTASLAALDGLKRVIRIESTSKILPALARVGSIAAAPALISELARLKLITGSGGTEFVERVALHALSSGEYRRHITRTRARLEHARGIALQLLPHFALEPLAVPDGGMFISAGVIDVGMTAARALQLARAHRVILSPGSRFSCAKSNRLWFRLNVAYADHSAVHQVFNTLAQASTGSS